MSNETKQVIARIGETDQRFLEGNTPELALERADLRLQLVMLSHVRQEQLHFLQEAIVLLEQARIEYDENAVKLVFKSVVIFGQGLYDLFRADQGTAFCSDHSANFEAFGTP